MRKLRATFLVVIALSVASAAHAQDSDLFTLVFTGTPETIQAAISRGADVNARGEEDWTPLMNVALSITDPRKLNVLLKAGAKVNTKNNDGNTPLMLASGYNDNSEVVSALLKAGADPNARNTVGLTPLMFAAGAIAFEHPWGMPFPQLAKSSEGKTNEATTVRTGSLYAPNGPVVDSFLLQAPAPNPEPTGLATARPVPLSRTNLSDRSLRAVTILLKAGADPNVRDQDGMTAIMWAAANNPDPQVLIALTRAGATLRALTAEGVTTLMIAAAKNTAPQALAALIKAGENPKAKDKNGWTALMYAAALNENPEIITDLLKAGADAKAASKEGKTAFDYADENANVKDTDAYWKLNDARY